MDPGFTHLAIPCLSVNIIQFEWVLKFKHIQCNKIYIYSAALLTKELSLLSINSIVSKSFVRA